MGTELQPLFHCRATWGVDYAACRDSIQKDRLRTYLVDMVWLAAHLQGVRHPLGTTGRGS